MSGARVSTGEGSRQNYGTPADFMAAVAKRFGPIQWDLAADATNHKHERYFAPKTFTEVFDPTDFVRLYAQYVDKFVDALVARGAKREEVCLYVERANGNKCKITVPNHDDKAAAFDTFAQDWAALSARYAMTGQNTAEGAQTHAGLLWDNCPFSQVDVFAAKHLAEARRGANTLLLVLESNAAWFCNHVAGRADVYKLIGRISFNGAPFMKDCILCHFHPWAMGAMALWDWKKDQVLQRWAPTHKPGEIT